MFYKIIKLYNVFEVPVMLEWIRDLKPTRISAGDHLSLLTVKVPIFPFSILYRFYAQNLKYECEHVKVIGFSANW